MSQNVGAAICCKIQGWNDILSHILYGLQFDAEFNVGFPSYTNNQKTHPSQSNHTHTNNHQRHRMPRIFRNAFEPTISSAPELQFCTLSQNGHDDSYTIIYIHIKPNYVIESGQQIATRMTSNSAADCVFQPWILQQIATRMTYEYECNLNLNSAADCTPYDIWLWM